VPQIVETHDAHAGAPARLLEALSHLRALQRLAGQWVGEHQVVLGRVLRPHGELDKRGRELFRQRHAA
jgi:hypothetical protein